MTRICPKCSYARKPTDDVPEWQCPSCQVAYNKVGGEPVSANYGRYGAAVVRQQTADFPLLKWLLIAVLAGAGVWAAKPLWQVKKAPVVVAASAQPEVILYSTEWCGYCTAAREFFDRNRIAYTDLDIEKTTRGYEEHKQLGGRGVPLMVIGDEVIHGYSEPTMRSNLQPWLKGS